MGALLLTWAVAVASCSRESTRARRLEPLEFELISKGSEISSGSTEHADSPAYRVFFDSGSWSDFWRRRFPDPVPSADSDDQLILCVFQGEKWTGGYGIEISAIAWDRENRLMEVFLAIQEPGPGDMVIQILTHPYAIYRVHIPAAQGAAWSESSLEVRFFQKADSKRASIDMMRL